MFDKFTQKYNQILNNKTTTETEVSAGILLYRINAKKQIEVLLGKNGGPAWQKRSVGAWNIPKGHVEENQSLQDCAVREFEEETSIVISAKEREHMSYLGMNSTKSGKQVHIFAIQKDCAPNGTFKVPIKSITCKTEWPEKSGNYILVPELSEASYFNLKTANNLIFSYQRFFLQSLKEMVII